jgi:[ribosomal protein S5]-alanine N-acetyltransferase
VPIELRSLERSDAPALLDLRLRNRAFFEDYEPTRDDSFYTIDALEDQLHLNELQRDSDQGYVFGIWLGSNLVGWVTLQHIVRRAWQNAILGYGVDQAHNGKGIATAAVAQTVRFAFEEAHLHRVEAGVVPRNVASIRVLEKAGFRYEGLARRYLQINGVWEDHNLYAITTEDLRPSNPG